MRRGVLFVALVAALTVLGAAPAFAAHCINQSKPGGAGNLTTVIIDVATGEASFEGVNAAGRLTGGFADVYLDFDGDGAGDLQVEDDVFLAANHSGKANPAQGEPAVIPGAAKNGSPDHGVGFAPEG
jgi:hypothetical protein